MKTKYEITKQGLHQILNNDGNFSIERISEHNQEGNIYLYNTNIGDNIFYSTGGVNITNEKEIHLASGIYYFDINSLNFGSKIFIDSAELIINGPGSFVINTTNKNQRSILSISSKIQVNLFDISSPESTATHLNLYPNMYIMYNPVYNKQIVNADLLRIQNVQHLGMLTSPIYETIIIEPEEQPTSGTGRVIDQENEISYELNNDLKTYLFYNVDDNFNLIQK
ncbi:hypothetical protein N8455_00720, partial [Candidatus Gracilibacteria bacterium]|nr:hypothetical protein [Candidatus Gracilibacteria bacterium]